MSNVGAHIIESKPRGWRELQERVGVILQECGLKVEIEKNLETVRGTVNVDVYAEDSAARPAAVYLCECKHWRSAVPKTVVHAFRTVVSDQGANWGLIISSEGFQRGAYEAAASSNVRLLNWESFQELFIERWIDHYMLPRIREEADPLVEYTEPINSRIFRKADALPPESQKRFVELRREYSVLAFFALHLYVFPPTMRDRLPQLPLKNALDGGGVNTVARDQLPDDLLRAESLREFAGILCKHARAGVDAFDRLFGGRA